MSLDDYRIDNVWQNRDETLQQEIIAFWLAQNALPSSEEAQRRVHQVVYVARDGAGNIVGLNTVYPHLNRRLEHYFFYYRVFVSPEHRRNKLSDKMTALAYAFFNQRFKEGKNPRIIGLFAVVESKILQRHAIQAVRPGGLTFIGRDEKGNDLRIAYFDGALIRRPGQQESGQPSIN